MNDILVDMFWLSCAPTQEFEIRFSSVHDFFAVVPFSSKLGLFRLKPEGLERFEWFRNLEWLGVYLDWARLRDGLVWMSDWHLVMYSGKF